MLQYQIGQSLPLYEFQLYSNRSRLSQVLALRSASLALFTVGDCKSISCSNPNPNPPSKSQFIISPSKKRIVSYNTVMPLCALLSCVWGWVCLIYLKGYRITMSSFKSKAQLLKAQLCEEQQEQQQVQIVKECRPNVPTAKQELSLQQPIIIERKTVIKSESQTFKKTKQEDTYTRKKVEPWAPISVPVRQKKMDLENMSINTPAVQGNKQIEIQIEKDDKNKDCLKKLFKKVRKLEDDLKQSQKERMRLNLELENYKNRTKICSDHDKVIAKLQAENYRLAVDLDMLKRLIKEREDQIQRLNLRAPKEIIKEVIVEKPVEVVVQVPKMIPGPERIVEKIVEIPKYIEVEKKVIVQVVKEVPREVIKTVTVQVPTIVEKPVYIDKPIYIESPPIQREKIVEVPVRVDVPYEVPVQYPVYIDKPVVEEEWLLKIRELEEHLQYSLRDNAFLVTENGNLRLKVSQLSENLEVLRRHNEEKNREVEILLQNNSDYMPFSPNQQDYSMGSVKYSISSHPHPRII